MMELKRNLSLATYLLARKTSLHRKKTKISSTHGFFDSLVVFNLVCIGVDVLKFHLIFDICETTNKILYSIVFTLLKSLLLLGGRHNCSWKTKSLRMSKLAI